jgi:hypothetical protein
VPSVPVGGPAAVYEPPPGMPEIVLVDIDGTVALIGDRSPWNMRAVGQDEPNHAVIAAVRAMHQAGYGVIYCTGRDTTARAATERWLDAHVGVPYLALHMRRFGDSRQDAVVKRDIFHKEIREHFRVIGVFDDRQQVVRMWRELGLTVFQVADGDF